MAQAQHGSAPSLAGKDVANPASLILSAGMLLDWLRAKGHGDGFAQAARAVEFAVQQCLKDATTRTPDLGGTAGTQAMATSIANIVRRF